MVETTTDCVVCGANVWRTKFHKQGFDFVECEQCGLLKLSPLPTVEQLDEHYSARAVSGNYEAVKSIERLPTSQQIFDYIERFSPQPGRIFDIGCFDGQLLDVAKAKGWETWGLELQGPAAERANVTHGGRVFMQTVEEFKPTNPGYYDVVSAVGLIEHVRDPHRLMIMVRDLLKPGGIFVVQTPNWGSMLAKAMGRYWFPIAAPEHIHYFSHRTLAKLCTSFGMTAVTWKPHWKPLRLGYALDQMSYFGEEVGRVVTKIRPIIPGFAERAQLPLFGGEMLFVARKSGN